MKRPERGEKHQFNARIDGEAYEWLRLRAFKNYRSINSELNQIIMEMVKSEASDKTEKEAPGESLATNPDAS